MIDRDTHNRQSQRDIHAGVKGEHLEWDVTLVVVHANDGVQLAPAVRDEGRIGRNWTFYLEAFTASRRNSGLDEALFFQVAEKAVLARMRIQAADAKARVRSRRRFTVSPVNSITSRTRSVVSRSGTCANPM